jgi:hypothetical protein
VRIGTTILTITTQSGSGTKWQSDAWNLVAATVERGSTGYFGRVHILREDGVYETYASSEFAGPYGPRTTTEIAVGTTAGPTSQNFHGDLLCVVGLDQALKEYDFRSIMGNPFQLLRRNKSILVPTGVKPRTEEVISHEGLIERDW